MAKILAYSTKSDKLTKLCKLIAQVNFNRDLVSHRKSRTHNPKSLKELRSDVLSIKIPNVCLNIVWAAYIWPSKLGICKDFSLVLDNVKVQVPGLLVLSSRIQWTRSIWGKIHRFFYFLTRIQRECCKGGLEHISQKPWVDVARSRKTHPNYGRGLSRPYVSSQITVIHFQKGAEECVRELRN